MKGRYFREKIQRNQKMKNFLIQSRKIIFF